MWGPRNVQKGVHEVHRSYFYTTAILTSFSSYAGGGVKIAPVLYNCNVRYLSCYCQEFRLVARILPALKTSLLVSALCLLLCDCVLRASFGARQDTDPILSADILSRTPLSLGLTCFGVSSRLANNDILLLGASTCSEYPDSTGIYFQPLRQKGMIWWS